LDVIREKDVAKKNSVGVIKVKFYRERKKRVNLCSEKQTFWMVMLVLVLGIAK